MSSPHIVIRGPKERPADPTRPETYAGYHEAYAKAKQMNFGRDIEFNSEGERKDYERAVRSNPSNIPGLPAFFPPLETKVFVPMDTSPAEIQAIPDEDWDILPCGHTWKTKRYCANGILEYICHEGHLTIARKQ